MTRPRTFLSHRHALLYWLAVNAYRVRRHLRWRMEDLSGHRTAQAQVEHRLPVRVKKHESRLLRQLGQSEMWLQHNKVKNLEIAIRPLHGLLIRPGETFSFWRRVGRPTRAKGYIEGMEISRGQARPGMSEKIAHSYTVIEKDHAFERVEGQFYRRNTLWRQVRERRTGRFLGEEFIKKNRVRVMYVPEGFQ